MADTGATGAARRDLQLAGQGAGGNGVAIRLAPPAQRLSLRARASAVAAVSAPLGMALPIKPRGVAVAEGRHALRLGPDEWLVIDESGRDPLGDLVHATAVHSAVDVSHRNVAFLVSGERVEDVLSAGCPLDLAVRAFPTGTATRTVFGKIEVVLYRVGETEFRMECWRSFAPYALDLLRAAARDVG